jgi:hypothetical protein
VCFGEPFQVAGDVCLDRLGEAVELKDSQRYDGTPRSNREGGRVSRRSLRPA